jgi:SAM-dependent methyltransferase
MEETTETPTMSDAEIVAALSRYKFYHVIPVTETLSTPGIDALVKLAAPVLRLMDLVDFEGKRVLDVGCRDGLFSFEAEERGAAEILGIDTCLSLGAVEFLIPFKQSKVQMRELSLFELDDHGQFDVILFCGVLYHLRYPFLAIKKLSELLPDGGRMIIETAIFADDDQRSLLYCPVGEESPYEPSSVTFFNRKGLSDTLGSFGLGVDATDYMREEDRQRTDGRVLRGMFLCTKKDALMDRHPHRYWSGATHKTWTLG